MSERDELVARLRNTGANNCWYCLGDRHANTAADQIERDGREIERLREALTRIAEYRSQAVAYDDDMGYTRRDFDIGAVIRMESIARAALNKDTNQ